MAELSRLGRYELRRLLGRGAMGVVYEGFDPTLNRRVAVKTILKSFAMDEATKSDYSARFVREAQAVGRLNHPNIVQVHDFGEENEVAYLVMEFIQGRELRSYFEANEEFEPDETVRIMGELLDALQFAHEAGVIHRDIKPANVMLDSQRRAKLADFGVARVQDNAQHSVAGTMVGTPAFMSPEQISGRKIDRRTDIFSAGTILYQFLTGEQPFKGEGAWTVAKKIMESTPPPPSTVAKSISPAFDAVVSRALAKSPGQRYASAKEFAAALRDALAAPAQAVTAAETRTQAKGETKASETELEFWRSIQNRDDLDELELYVEQFPSGAYSQLARLKIAKLKEPILAARKAAEEQARREAEEAERVRQEAEAKERREAEEYARRAAAEKAMREAAEKAKREAEEKARQAQALARLKQQQAAAKAAADEDATVATAGAAAATPAARKSSYALPVLGAAVVVAAIGAYLMFGRSKAPEPVAQVPAVPKTEIPVPAVPPKAEVSAAEVERIRKEAEERVRREFADKSAAEQAAAKAAATKAAAEKAALEKAALDKAAAEKVVAEKAMAAKASAERTALEKAAAEKAAAEKVAAEKVAADKLAADKTAADRAAAEKAAAEKSAAAKAAAAAKPGWPSVGDRWVYEVREANHPDRKTQIVVDVQAVTPTSVRERVAPGSSPARILTQQADIVATGIAPGVASFLPYLRAFHEPRSGDKWPKVQFNSFFSCNTAFNYCGLSARIAGKERVTVRAGAFDAWKVVLDMTGRASRGGGTGEFTFWYAEEAKRIVKYQSRVQWQAVSASLPEWNEPDMDMELLSYTPAGAK